jgi:hypothetical protein
MRWIDHVDPRIDVAVVAYDTDLDEPSGGSEGAWDSWSATLGGLDSPPQAGSQVRFMGYPSGLRDAAHWAPIVRSGVVATRPDDRVGTDRSFLIDASVFPGSSGSPVYLADGPEEGRLAGILAARHLTTSVGLMNSESAEPVIAESLDLGVAFSTSTIWDCARESAFRNAHADKVCAYAGVGSVFRMVVLDHHGHVTTAAGARLDELELAGIPGWSVASVLNVLHDPLRDHPAVSGAWQYGGQVDVLERLGLPARGLTEVLSERAQLLGRVANGELPADEELF